MTDEKCWQYITLTFDSGELKPALIDYLSKPQSQKSFKFNLAKSNIWDFFPKPENSLV